MSVWKRERENFILGAGSQGGWQAQALTTNLCWQDGYLEFYKERLGAGVHAREGAGNLWSCVEGVSVCSVHDHGQGKGCAECGLLGILLLSELFWSDGCNVWSLQNVFVNASRKCDNKSRTIRKKNNGFQLEHGLSGLVYFWFYLLGSTVWARGLTDTTTRG